MNPFVELHCHSNFSFLDGASHPFELAQRAAELEMPALAITDWGGVYGAVRFDGACRKLGVRPILGASLETDGRHLVLLARTLKGWSNLCRLLSLAHREQGKGEARATLEQVAELRGDLFYLTPTEDERWLRSLQDGLGRENVFVEVSNLLRSQDRWLAQGRIDLARRCGSGIVASNDVHYHLPERRALHDVQLAIKHRATLTEARAHLNQNSERHLKGGDQMRGLFKDLGCPEALATPWELAQECRFGLDFKAVRFPGYSVPKGETPFSHLYQLCQQGARERYHPITPAVARRLTRELDVIEKTGLAEFFLINWDLMRFARERGVPGQGRGSAADSIVAYVLGITRVDPIEHNLLFERFLHEEMTSTPDIDIDFSTEHREQVIQYIYDKYGWERTGMVCNLVTYRPRLAIRQVGKALGFPADLLDRLAKGVDRWFYEEVQTSFLAELPEAGIASRSWLQFLRLCREIQGFPRHLSIHVGGMLVTGEPLVDIVPVEPATMPGRVVVQFDKSDVEDLGLIKMDMLGLRTLSVVAECLQLIERETGERPDLDRLPLDDPEVFEMCSEADTIGVFQIESRAQMATLPRTRPREFNDLVVEVAIIRPGPIQGNAVHPYIKRKQGREPVTYAHPLLEPILRDTLGVILYQEQILEIAISVAGMTAGEADRFRRAMNKAPGTTSQMRLLHDDFVNGCLGSGVPLEVCEDLFRAVEGFAAFGFCRSHAAAFARTSYETAWLKLRWPAHFYCGLLNNQPMGFYHPSVLVEDAKRHGVTALPVDANLSAERCLPGSKSEFRLGFNYVRDLGSEGAAALVAERERGGPYRSLDDFLERLRGAPVNPRAVRNLVMVGAFDSLGTPRRALLWSWQERWDGRGLKRKLSVQSELSLPSEAPPLGAPDEWERTRLQYRISEVSTGKHLVAFWRERLAALGVVDSRAAGRAPSGARLRVGGLVITRQAPGTAGKIRFFTLEDEFGHVNVTIKPEVYERNRRVANQSPILVIDGVIQTQDGVHSLLATEIQAPEGAGKEHSRSHDYK